LKIARVGSLCMKQAEIPILSLSIRDFTRQTAFAQQAL